MMLTKNTDSIPAAVQVTLKAFEKLVAIEEQRRRELLDAVSSSARQRLTDPNDRLQYLVAFADALAPHLDELRAVDRRIALIRARLSEIRSRWGKPPGTWNEPSAPRRPWQGLGGGTLEWNTTLDEPRTLRLA
jgi:hypothetical protein